MPRSFAVNKKCFLATAEVVPAAATTRSPLIPQPRNWPSVLDLDVRGDKGGVRVFVQRLDCPGWRRRGTPSITVGRELLRLLPPSPGPCNPFMVLAAMHSGVACRAQRDQVFL